MQMAPNLTVLSLCLAALFCGFVSCSDYANEAAALTGEITDCVDLEIRKMTPVTYNEMQFVNHFGSGMLLELKHNESYIAAYSNSQDILAQAARSKRQDLVEPLTKIVNQMHGTVDAVRKCAKSHSQAKKANYTGLPFSIYFLASSFDVLKQKKQALKLFKEAIEINKNFAEAYSAAGMVLMDQHNYAEALDFFKDAVRLHPMRYYTHKRVGLTYYALGRYSEAEKAFDIAIKLEPDDADLYSSRAAALQLVSAKRYNESEAMYKKALEMKPNTTELYISLGTLMKLQNRIEESKQYFEKALEIAPNSPAVHKSYANLLAKIEDHNPAIEHYALAAQKGHYPSLCTLLYTKQEICNWTNYEEEVKKVKEILDYQLGITKDCPVPPVGDKCPLSTEQPCLTPSQASQLPIDALTAHKLAAKFAKSAKKYSKSAWEDFLEGKQYQYRPIIPLGNKIRVGYISNTARDHIVGTIISYVLKEQAKKKNMEVYFYALHPDKSETRERIEDAVDSFVDISNMSTTEASIKINDDNIEILVNLDGHFSVLPAEILAVKPAPVQISFLGWPGTVGSKYMTYLVADENVVPPKEDYWKYYAEKIIYMPDSFLPAYHQVKYKDALDSTPNAKFPEKEGEVFGLCNINRVEKLDPETFQAWLNILKGIPTAKLYMNKVPPEGKENILVEASKQGVDASRFEFWDKIEDHLSYIKRIKEHCHLTLDPVKYNSHSSGLDTLFAGVPLVTLSQERYQSRVSKSLISGLHCENKLDSLVTSSFEQYTETAIRLGTNKEQFTELQDNLVKCIKQAGGLFDLPNWVKKWERALQSAYKNYKKGLEENIFVK